MKSPEFIISYIKPLIDSSGLQYNTDKWDYTIYLKDGSKYEAISYVMDRFGEISTRDIIIIKKFLKEYELPF